MAHFRTEEDMFPLVEGWQGSGQTQKAFCAEQDISVSVFAYWLRRYRDQVHVFDQSASFVPIQPASSSVNALEVELPTGTILRFAQVVPVGYLKSLL